MKRYTPTCIPKVRSLRMGVLRTKMYKNYLITAAGLILIIGGPALSYIEFFRESLKGLPYGLIGIGCGMFGYGFGELYTKRVYRKHPDIEHQNEINKNDERNITLGNIAKAKAFNIMTYVFGAVILAFGFMGISPEIVLTLVAVYLFVEIYAVYNRIRLEKEL